MAAGIHEPLGIIKQVMRVGHGSTEQRQEVIAGRYGRVGHADTEMKRHALEKANSATTHSPLPTPLWHDREDIIQRLCGLKE